MALGVLVLLIYLERSAQALPQPELNFSGLTSSAPITTIHSVIQQARAAWVNEDADAFASLFTQAGEFLVPGNRWVGQEAIRQVAADFATSSSHVTIEMRRIIVENNQAVVEWHWEDTDASGRRNRADDAIVVDFVGDRISRWREYIDTQTPEK